MLEFKQHLFKEKSWTRKRNGSISNGIKQNFDLFQQQQQIPLAMTTQIPSQPFICAPTTSAINLTLIQHALNQRNKLLWYVHNEQIKQPIGYL